MPAVVIDMFRQPKAEPEAVQGFALLVTQGLCTRDNAIRSLMHSEPVQDGAVRARLAQTLGTLTFTINTVRMNVRADICRRVYDAGNNPSMRPNRTFAELCGVAYEADVARTRESGLASIIRTVLTENERWAITHEVSIKLLIKWGIKK